MKVTRLRRLAAGVTLIALTGCGVLQDEVPEPVTSSDGGHDQQRGAPPPPREEEPRLEDVAPAGPATTGLPEDARLDPMGSTSVDEDGATLTDVHVAGDLTVAADGVLLRRVRVDGSLRIRGSQLTVEDSEVGAVSISGEEEVVLRRTEVFGTPGSDGIHITSDSGPVRDVLIEDCWIHSPQVEPDSHYDGVQVRGVDGLVIRGTTIDLGPPEPQHNAAVFLQEANGGNRSVVLEDNWLAGGGYTLYLAGTDVLVRGNRLSRVAAFGPVYPDTAPDDLVAEANTWLDGAPLSVRP
jgi:hypothetical protein